MPVLLRSRAFLRHGVALSLLSDAFDAIVEIDRVRLAQIITNGLRYVLLLQVALLAPDGSAEH